MLVKYLLPLLVVVGVQLVLNSYLVEAQADGEKDDLDSAELFLRPVVIKYGHDHPGIYTWQGGSGVGMGWGIYPPKAQTPQGGWGKKKKKKSKKPKKKKSKKPKKKKSKKPKKKKKEKKGGWGWSWGWIGEEGGEGDDGGDDEKEKSRANLPVESVVARFGRPNVQSEFDYEGEYEEPPFFRNTYNL